ncbi:hypothetical protein [Salinarimonas soli]|uniref:hypothetical protein n=1 Tax=Salinarimonas soli TaxID=1638099 RepID=UPI001661CF63|nr:hypothetical protein [Salinarimonas soli]
MNGRSSRAPNRSAPGADRPSAGAAERGGRVAALTALALSLSACAETGDFGRPRPSVWSDTLLPAAGALAAGFREEPVSFFDLTDDEAALRDRAWRFLTPAHERAWFDRQVSALVRARVLPLDWRPTEPGADHAALTAGPVRSPVSRYRRLAEDVTADRALIAPFAAVASRVIEADRRRLRAVPFLREAPPDRVAAAVARVAENRCVVAWVRQALAERTEGYAHALEQLFLETPDLEAIGPERALGDLRLTRTLLDALPVPPLADGGCIGAEALVSEREVAPARARLVTK